MKDSDYVDALIQMLAADDQQLSLLLREKCEVLTLKKGETLIAFQSSNRKIYWIATGSFIRNIITSRGEEKTVMFHTESFCEFFKSYDTVYLHSKTNYEIIANEAAVVIAIHFDILMNVMKNNLKLLQFYNEKTEALFVTIDLFRNFQLGLTSEEYLDWLYHNYPFLFKRFPAQSIASFMGITPVWLSKLKAKLIS
ncbi:Crp/Fnr family transcriptional regulator [Chitinophaga sp. Cy-1792]|uniref:Crp/Fnr family transcriptional regulator n=1 Tax=Chitinophaga sp. Cy-1792 TaxID=2608339 RepID=UPI0014204D23|nr:Crp/Fnr family transcriptional regulator [Chitinophaga sp. Cy-1792]NIG54352.1 Crp/Fnr family transcriptional regulator [Chitinophaga sp. Cy-1792]